MALAPEASHEAGRLLSEPDNLPAREILQEIYLDYLETDPLPTGVAIKNSWGTFILRDKQGEELIAVFDEEMQLLEPDIFPSFWKDVLVSIRQNQHDR